MNGGDLTIDLPALHPGQRTVARHPARFHVLACGRRWGKTRLGIWSGLREALSGRRGWWIGPNYKTARIAWRPLRRLSRTVPGVTVSETDLRIDYPGGGWFQIRSGDDPDSLRGEGLHYCVLDECAFLSERVWTEAIRPSLSDHHGRALFISTPKGMNWFWRLWLKGQEEANEACPERSRERSRGEWMSWRFPSVSNPYLDPREIEQARHDLPERVFAQEYEAEFLEDAGGVFRGVTAVVDRGRTAPEEPIAGMEYFAGADLARVEDFTVISVLDANRRQVCFERFNEVSWERARAAIVRTGTRFNRATLLIDSTGVGDPVVEELEKAYPGRIVPLRWTNALKTDMVNALAISIESGAVRLMDIPVQTSELLAYQYEMTRMRNMRCGAPAGMNDDTVSALMMANRGIDEERALEWS